MPAAIDTMAYVGATPWHGEGKNVTDPAIMRNAEAFCAEALVNWVAEVEALFCQDGTPVPSRAVVRVKDGKKIVLGVVGPRWQPLQNIDAFKFFQPWLDAGLADLHTAGSLFDGEKVWVLARLAIDNGEVVKGDEIMPYVLLSNAHDGKNAVRVGFTPIRVVCNNTLSAAHDTNVSKLIKVRHTGEVVQNLDKLRDTMNLLKSDFDANMAQYQFLASKQYNAGTIKTYVKMLLDVADVADDELPTRTVNRMQDIMTKIVSGRGQNTPGIAGTWWAAYNGYNEYLNYVEGRNTANRLDSIWFGQGVNKNRDALALAMEMASK